MYIRLKNAGNVSSTEKIANCMTFYEFNRTILDQSALMEYD